MSISNGLNKQSSIFEVVTKSCCVRQLFCSVKKLFTALSGDFDSNFQNDILKGKLDNTLILKKRVVKLRGEFMHFGKKNTVLKKTFLLIAASDTIKGIGTILRKNTS